MLEEFRLTGFGGNDLALGNVDADPSQEIVVTLSGYGSTAVYVIDVQSQTVQWDYLNGFGAKVAVGDVDADGIDEVVAMADWGSITVIDAELQIPAWEITTSDNAALLLTDISGDGIPEILYGDGQHGRIHVVDGQTREETWSIANPSLGVTNLATADTDQDGVLDILWGAGDISTGSDHLYIADQSTARIQWSSADIDGPLSAVDVGDVDDDGDQEIVMVSFKSNSGYDPGVIHIFNAISHQLEWSGPLSQPDWMGVRSVKIGDVDSDGETEFVVTTANLYSGEIHVFDGRSHALEAKSREYEGLYFTDLDIADVDNDGQPEIVAGQGKQHTGATGSYLIVLNGATLEEEWRSTILSSDWFPISDLLIEDVDGDGNPEILGVVRVATSSNVESEGESQIYVYDGVTQALDGLFTVPAKVMSAEDIDGDGIQEILFGRTDGAIDIYSGTDLGLESSITLPVEDDITVLRTADINADGTVELLVGAQGQLSVVSADGQTLLWQSDYLGDNLGSTNHLAVTDLDADGATEVVFGTQTTLYQHQIGNGQPTEQ